MPGARHGIARSGSVPAVDAPAAQDVQPTQPLPGRSRRGRPYVLPRLNGRGSRRARLRLRHQDRHARTARPQPAKLLSLDRVEVLGPPAHFGPIRSASMIFLSASSSGTENALTRSRAAALRRSWSSMSVTRLPPGFYAARRGPASLPPVSSQASLLPGAPSIRARKSGSRSAAGCPSVGAAGSPVAPTRRSRLDGFWMSRSAVRPANCHRLRPSPERPQSTALSGSWYSSIRVKLAPGPGRNRRLISYAFMKR